jgi:hypothetical protein
MISIAACAGFKYYAARPPLTMESVGWDYRDNMIYLSLGFSDWENDQAMLRFVVEAHIPSISLEYVIKMIEGYVVDNATPQIHIVYSQNTDVQNEGMMVWHGLEMPAVSIEDDVAVTVVQHIERKKAFYAAEWERRGNEVKAYQEQEAKLELERDERRRKRKEREARKAAKDAAKVEEPGGQFNSRVANLPAE